MATICASTAAQRLDKEPKQFSKIKERRTCGLRSSVFRLSASQFLELEARAKLHLERNARIVADDDIAAGVSQLSEVRVGGSAETAADCRWRAIGGLRPREGRILEIEEIEELSRDHEPPGFAETKPLLHPRVHVVESQIAKCVAFEG